MRARHRAIGNRPAGQVEWQIGEDPIKRQRISLTGRVQGVGFRPAVYRLASGLGLSGFVLNDTRGVTVEVQGEDGALSEFIRSLESGAGLPGLADIRSCEVRDVEAVEGEEGFVIRASEGAGGGEFGGDGGYRDVRGVPAGDEGCG